jgi:acyl-coenzyme A thioesterase PaaI-like protein
MNRFLSSKLMSIAVLGSLSASMVSIDESSGTSSSVSKTEIVQDSKDEYRTLDLSKFPLDSHLLHASLKGENKLERYILSLSSDKQKLKAEAFLGKELTSHPSVVHGGAIAALIDDSFGSLCFSAFGSCFTANLNINYKVPLNASTHVVVNCAITEVTLSKSGSKKIIIKGTVSDAEDSSKVYSDATALFISKDVPTSHKLAAAVAESVNALFK